jgi:hypothetical protein
MMKIPTWAWFAFGGGALYAVLKSKSAAAEAAVTKTTAPAAGEKGVVYRDVKTAEQTAADQSDTIEAFVLDLAKRFVELRRLGNTKYESSQDVWSPLTAANARETIYASYIRQGGTPGGWMTVGPQVEIQLAQIG